MARPISPAASAARPGRLRNVEGPSGLLRDDVLEGRPREYREHSVVQEQEEEVALALGRDRSTDPANDQRNRKREDEQWQEKLPRASCGGHRGHERADCADADVGEEDAGQGRRVEWSEEEDEGRQRDSLRRNEEGERCQSLPEPDRASVARSEHETVEHAVLLLGHPGASEAEQRGEDDRDPEKPVRRVVASSPG